jgi:pimeloyl-ACP methyl ester carboxylesterase
MGSIDLGRARLHLEISGDGEPVLLIHGSGIAEGLQPLTREPLLSKSYRLIGYHRRGYAGSDPVPSTPSIHNEVEDCRALLRYLGVEKAHVVGHSFGGAVALQLAMDAPEQVGSLALLEPALALGDSAGAYKESLARATQRYREAGPEVALHEMLAARWPEYEGRLESALPGAFVRAVEHAFTWFEADLAALLSWDFDEGRAAKVTQPTLSVMGSLSDALSPRFREVHDWLKTRLLEGEGFVLPEAHHFLQVENPRPLAGALADFYSRNPL